MRVYFDYNATTPLAPDVIEAVARASRDTFGNASSVHHFGQQAKATVDDARSAVAALMNADPSEIVSPSRLRDAIVSKTALVSVMHANNEIGTIQPIAELAAIAHE